MTVNPIAAGLLATQLVGEPITPNLIIGLVAVFAGIWIATTEARREEQGAYEHHPAIALRGWVKRRRAWPYFEETALQAGAREGLPGPSASTGVSLGPRRRGHGSGASMGHAWSMRARFENLQRAPIEVESSKRASGAARVTPIGHCAWS